jgi:hypothetical protein
MVMVVRSFTIERLTGDISGIRDRLIGDEVGLADKHGFTSLHFAAGPWAS